MAFLKILTGPGRSQKVNIDRDEVIIGRNPENVLPIEDVAASGRHCAIVREGRRFTLHDLGSTNGTRLNDVKVTEYRLSPKDVITVGATQILFDGDDIDSEEPVYQEEARNNRTVRIDTEMLGGDYSAFHARYEKKLSWGKLIIVLGGIAILAAIVYLFCLFSK